MIFKERISGLEIRRLRRTGRMRIAAVILAAETGICSRAACKPADPTCSRCARSIIAGTRSVILHPVWNWRGIIGIWDAIVGWSIVAGKWQTVTLVIHIAVQRLFPGQGAQNAGAGIIGIGGVIE